MFEITVTGHFDSAHYLDGYKGKCDYRYPITDSIPNLLPPELQDQPSA